MKSLLGHVSSAIPSHKPSWTLSKQNCFVQVEQGFKSVVGSSNTVELEPQKHLQNILISAAHVIDIKDRNKNGIIFDILQSKER